jgi:Fic family protein
MIELPPKTRQKNIGNVLKLISDQRIVDIVRDINEQYLYWTDVKYKPLPDKTSAQDLWTYVKFSRIVGQILKIGNYSFKLHVTDYMQQLCHEFDMNLGGYMGTQSFIPEADKNRYLVSSNMEEAIASSQMEGAATTRKIAKDMLRKSISPRTRAEQMIYNNYETIRFIINHKDEKFTKETLSRIHQLMTNKTLDDSRDEGRFRTDNNVVVEDGITHETIHTPPDHGEIDELIDAVCQFFNEDNYNGQFIHPIIKGVIIHFLIAFIHPFTDGNGRTARAIFYWHMLKRGYWLTEYLSISRIIARSKRQYEKAYLYTECDGNDLGYFIIYNLRAINLAYDELRNYIQRKLNEQQQASDFLKLGNINARQAQIIKWYHDSLNISFSVKEIQTRMNISYPTAKRDLDGLAELGYVNVVPVNKVKSIYIRSEAFNELQRNIKA